jgi:hypothetical protein
MAVARNTNHRTVDSLYDSSWPPSAPPAPASTTAAATIIKEKEGWQVIQGE